MNHDQLVKFCKEIIKLKEHLKCAICLEIIQDNAELACGHKFCNNCQTTLKDINRRIICPLCKAKITRRSYLYKDEIADKFGSLVSKICSKLENNQGCTVDKLVHGYKNPLERKKNNPVVIENQTNVETNETTPVKTSNKNYSEKDNQPSTSKKGVEQLPKKQSIVQKAADNDDIKLKRNANSSDTSEKKILKSTPKITSKTSSKKLHERAKTSAALEEKPSTSKETVFDKLTKKHCHDLLLNKRGTKVNYTRTMNKAHENDDYKILDFDNDDTKMSVLRWLNDNKNKFNRITQTQANNEEESNTSSDNALVDLTSISQVNQRKTNPLKIHISRKTRARSLDFEKKESAPKRFSDVGSRENYEIENNTEDILKKAEEAALLRIIEDKYLGEIEKQMQKTEKETTFGLLQKNDGKDIEHHTKQHSVSERGKLQKEIEEYQNEGKENKKKIGSKTKDNERNTTQSSISGWVRVNEELRKKGKQAKKLNITLESSHNTSDKKVGDKLLNITLIKEKAINVNSTKSEKFNIPSHNIFGDKILKVSLKKEDFITTMPSNKMELVSPNTQVGVGKPNVTLKSLHNTTDKKVGDKLSNITLIKEDKAINVNSTKSEKFNIPSHNIFGDKILKVSLKKEDFIAKTSSNKMELVRPNTQNSSTSSVENLNNRSYTNDQKLDKGQTVPTKLQKSGQDSNKENNENVFRLIGTKPNISILSDIVINKTNTVQNVICQEHKTDVNVQNTNMDIEDADVYELPTQKLFESEQFKSQQINEYETESKLDSPSKLNDSCSKLNSFDEVMNSLKKNLETYLEHLDNGKKLTKKHIKSIQKYLEKLNDLYGADHNKIPTSFTDQAVQIERVMCQNFAQTEKVFCCDAEVQTAELTEPSQKTKILKKLSGKYEDKLCSNRITAVKKTQSDAFAESLDILNFETQELEKQYLLKNKNKSMSNKKSQKEINKTQNIPLNKTQDLPTSKTNKSSLNLDDDDDDELLKENADVLVVSLKSDCVDNNSQKRAMSDSESSDIVLRKKRTKRMCNRFIRDDLSVEFGSSEKPKTEKSTFSPYLSTDSDEDNDEEFINGILKKYGSDPLSIKDDKNEEVDSNKKVEENVQHVSSESEYKTATNSYDDVMFNDDNLSKLDNEVRLLTEHKGDTEVSDVIEGTESLEQIPKRPTLERMMTNASDVIPETEDMEPLPKKPKLVLNTGFNEGVKNEKCLATEENLSTLGKTINKGTFCPELEDSFDGVDFENIAEELMDNVDELKKKERLKEDVDVPKSNEDDLFSDEDVVETTPQKGKLSVEKRSPNNLVTNLSSRFLATNNPEDAFAEDLDLDFIPLAPPPGFGDENADDTTPGNLTVISLEPKAIEEDKVTTPVKSSFYQINIGPVTPLNVVVQKLPHSTPRTQIGSQKESTLGLSPIPREKNIFERAFESSDTIISVLSQSTQSSTKKRNILTSNPKQKSILNYVKPPSSQLKPCIACTRLSKDQIQNISLLTNKKLATYSAKFTDSVTHMIVAVDEKRRIKDYTMKFVAAVASGIWVLCFDWIMECLKKNTIVSEDSFEVLDDAGNAGPKMARLTKNENPLLKDFWFYCVRPLYSTSVEDIEDVITKLGGVTVRNLESFSSSEGKINLIITEGRSTQDFEIYERWLEKYKVVTVDIEWLSRSVGRYKILSIKPYIWCSDDSVDDLGYPNYLTEVTSSCVSELS